MENLIKILTKRDGITPQEAKQRILETREALLNSKASYGDEIIMEYLGLEPDYIYEILSFPET